MPAGQQYNVYTQQSQQQQQDLSTTSLPINNNTFISKNDKFYNKNYDFAKNGFIENYNYYPNSKTDSMFKHHKQQLQQQQSYKENLQNNNTNNNTKLVYAKSSNVNTSNSYIGGKKKHVKFAKSSSKMTGRASDAATALKKSFQNYNHINNNSNIKLESEVMAEDASPQIYYYYCSAPEETVTSTKTEQQQQYLSDEQYYYINSAKYENMMNHYYYYTVDNTSEANYNDCFVQPTGYGENFQQQQQQQQKSVENAGGNSNWR